MPAIHKKASNPKIPDNVYKDILQGNYRQHLVTIDFNQFLSKFLLEEKACSEGFSNLKNCTLKNGHPMSKISLLKSLNEQDQFKHLWNFCGEFLTFKEHQIDENTTKNLLNIMSDFFSLFSQKNSDSSYVFTRNDSNTINSFFSFTGKFFQTPDFLDKTIHMFSGQNALNYSKELLKSIIKIAPNKTQESITANQTQRYNFDIIDPLKNFLVGAGNLISARRTTEQSYDFIEKSVIDLTETAIPKVESTELSNLRYLFLKPYNFGSKIEKSCKCLFKTDTCYPYNPIVNEQFKLIIQGKPPTNSTNFLQILEQLLFGSSKVVLNRLKDFNQAESENNKLANLLDYFNEKINDANKLQLELPAHSVEKLSQLLVTLKKLFAQVNSKPETLNKALSLFLTQIKNPKIKHHEPHYWRGLIACIAIVEASLKNPKTDNNSSMDILATIFQKIMDIADVRPEQKLINTEKIRNLTINSNQKIKTIVQEIICNATGKFLEQKLNGLALANLNGKYKNNYQLDIASKKIFNLSNCKDIASNKPIEMQGDIPLHTTLLPETTTLNIKNTTTTTFIPKIIANTSLVPTFNQTTPAVIVDPIPVAELPSHSSNGTLYNQTDVNNIENIENNLASSVPHNPASITVAAGYGGISGIFNAYTQHFHPNQPMPVIVGNTILATGVPLALLALELYLGSDTDTQDPTKLTYQDIIWQMPADLTGAVVANSVTYYFANASNNLSNYPILQSAVKHTLPFVTTAASIIKKPVETAVYIGTSIAASFSASRFFNRFWPRKEPQTSDVENAHEMQQLNEEKPESNKIDLNTVVDAEKASTTEEIFFKKVEFTTNEQYKHLKNYCELIKDLKYYLELIIKLVRELQKNLSDQAHIDRLDKILDIQTLKFGLCYDLDDLKDFPNKFITEYNKCKTDEEKSLVVKSNFDYFRTLIKTMYDKLLSDNVNTDCLNFILCLIKETRTLKDSITKLITCIEENLSFIRGKTKPIVSIHLPQKSAGSEILCKNGIVTIFRQNTGVMRCKYRHTFTSSSDSSDSALSDGYDNSRLNDPEQLETQKLLPLPTTHNR